jgi:ribonuclease D
VRLDAARAALRELSERVSVPTENLVTPELVRRLCWDWERAGDDAERSDEEERRIGHADDTGTAIDEFLAAGQARRWQRELVVPVLAAALSTTPEGTEDVSPAAR